MRLFRIVALFSFAAALTGCQVLRSGAKLAPAGSGGTTPPGSNAGSSGGSTNGGSPGSGSGSTGGGNSPGAPPALFYVEVLNGTTEQLYGLAVTATSVNVTPGSPFGASSPGYSGFSAAGGFLFAADASSIKAWSIDSTSGATTQTAQVPQPAKFIGGLAADPKDQFLFEPSADGYSDSGFFVYGYSVAADGSLTALKGAPFLIKSAVLGSQQSTVISPDGRWLCMSEYHGSPDSAILCYTVDPSSGALTNGTEAGVGNAFDSFAFLGSSYLAVSAEDGHTTG